MRVLFAAFAVAAVVAVDVASVEAASAGPALNQAIPSGCSRTTCVVHDNPGGEISVFQSAARELVAEGKHLVIDGRCASACVVLADMARSNTCITQNARIEVHQAEIVEFTGQMTMVAGQPVPVAHLVRREDPPQSPDINRWVKAHGGYPTSGLMEIPVSAAKQFWSMCQ